MVRKKASCRRIHTVWHRKYSALGTKNSFFKTFIDISITILKYFGHSITGKNDFLFSFAFPCVFWDMFFLLWIACFLLECSSFLTNLWKFFIHQECNYFVLLFNFNVIVQSLSYLWLFATPWTAAHQASLSFTIPRSLLKLMSTESVMSSNHLILCRPLLLPLSIFPSIRVFSNESVLRMRWPKY